MVDSKKIIINPVTRIEGHANITIDLNDKGAVTDAHFHVNEFRGFEKFCEGRPYTEMTSIAPRICGICPVSHAVASAKACEMIMRVTPPVTATLLRRIMHLGQMISSHALSFFHLSSPDFLLGFDSDPEKRNILGIAEKFPDLAVRGIRLRKFGQEASERITGKKIHAVGIVAGGMTCVLTEENRQALLAWVPEALETTRMALDIFKKFRKEMRDEFDGFASFKTLYMGTVGPKGELELYDGKLRFVSEEGAIIADQLDAKDYLQYIAERPVEFSYLKSPYYKPLGYPQGIYRVGPLGRLNVASCITTPLAQKEFLEFKQMGQQKPLHGSFYFHYARLIETLYSVEEMKNILEDPRVTSPDVFAQAGHNQSEGVGSSEAPRGTLFHHYFTDENGILKKINLLIATGQNNPAMNRSVLEVAKKYVDGRNVKEGALNRVEAAIRCYDPCLSCSTHALGAMPLQIQIRDHTGQIIRTLQRGQ